MNDIKDELLLLEDIKKSINRFIELTGCKLIKYENHINKRLSELNTITVKPSKAKRRRMRKRLRDA